MMYLLDKTIARATIPVFPILSPDADSDDVNTHSIGTIIVASVVPITIVSTLFAFARLFVKGWIQRRIQYDDGILLLAVASGWTATGTTLKAVALGNGKHAATLTDEQKEATLRWTAMSFAFGIVAVALPKLAIVAQINRILNPRRLHRSFLWVLVLICAVGLMGNVVGLLTQCPRDEVVQITFTKTACLGPERAVAYSISTSAISAATNGYLAVYVAFSVRRLKITRRKRVALAIALVLGLLALFTALFKCTRLKALGSPDFTYDSGDLLIWTSLEADVVVIAACIPALQPLVDHRFPDHFPTPATSPAVPSSPRSTDSAKKNPHGVRDLEAGENFSLSSQVPEMIFVEKEFEIAYSRTEVTRSRTSDSCAPSIPPEERLQIVKNKAPDGSITTTVVVKSSTRPPNDSAFPTEI
ncbi:hypothetical protein CTA2_11553 [Colletotrichum tanaceti]|uniref:Rhodopsin domain-containing protein n=1 Tax=Colletotrichum tanaceti TaxID=1306861 RepID=A0A4U6X9D4_9PEZI|nr:hypothetical protein CTA2_11553 [Colletotrichum tanaceti]TKW51753.1 hypothetical protein CTA1_1061 [Colletotrichum tanaceti]